MWIENIDLDDFGCFNRAPLRNLENGLTVISGPQRAGKSTFMHAVRCLGYGISSGDDIPPASDKYAVTADLVTDEGRYELSLEGYANPTITCRGDAPERTARELYGGLGQTQYQQLYTISLDELRRLPNSLEDDVDLSAILLGAAYGEIMDIPDVRDALANEAKSIGGKHGRGVYDMGDPMDRIEDGIEERDRALEQVDKHEQTATERDQVESRIAEIDERTESLEAEQIRLEAVQSTHDDYGQLQELEEQVAEHDIETVNSFPIDRLDRAKRLEGEYDDALSTLQERIDEFTASISTEAPTEYRGRLLAERDAIERYAREKAGWRQRLETLNEEKEELRSRKRELQHRIKSLHPTWEGDLTRVRDLEVNLVNQDSVRSTVEAYQDIDNEVATLEQTIAEFDERESGLENRIEDAVESTNSIGLRDQTAAVAAGSLIAVIVGLVAGIVGGAAVGVIVTAGIFVVTGAYVGSQLDAGTPSHNGVAVDTLRSEREKVASERNSKKTTLEGRKDRLEELEQEVDRIRETYELPADMSPDAIREFHREVVALQEAVTGYDDRSEDFDQDRAELKEDLSTVADTLQTVGVLEDDWADPVDDASTIFAAIDRASEHLETAEEVAAAEQSATRVEQKVIKILSAWEDASDLSDGDREDTQTELRSFLQKGEEIEAALEVRAEAAQCEERLRSALRKSSVEPSLKAYRDPDDGEEWHLHAYERILEEYSDVEAITAQLETIDEKLQELDEERTQLVERRVELTQELEELRSDDDVREAHTTIERGRKRLEPLAENYATHRIAEYLLDELHERFVERTTGPLLDEAAEIFERITGSTYVDLDSTDEFESLDFEATLDDGGTHRSAELSRATAEQLFLSVRLAKIKLHDVPLPVLLDDSLTNFDPVHVHRTLQVVDELAAETQVFLLTCHPTLLEHVERNAAVSQYWSLDMGEFDGPHETIERPQASLSATARGASGDD